MMDQQHPDLFQTGDREFWKSPSHQSQTRCKGEESKIKNGQGRAVMKVNTLKLSQSEKLEHIRVNKQSGKELRN